VYSTQQLSWLVSVGIAFFLDLVIMEITMEAIIAMFFSCRKGSEGIK